MYAILKGVKEDSLESAVNDMVDEVRLSSCCIYSLIFV